EDQATGGRCETTALGRGAGYTRSLKDVLLVQADNNVRVQVDNPTFQGLPGLDRIGKDTLRLVARRPLLREIEQPQHHLLAHGYGWFAGGRAAQVARGQHECARLLLRLLRE